MECLKTAFAGNFNYLLSLLLLFNLVTVSHQTHAQEFPKGWVFPVDLGQGLRTGPKLKEELYLASLAFEPMYTVIPGKLRLGATLSGIYTSRAIDGLVGPRIAFKLTEKGALKSSIFNAQVFGEYLWGTRQTSLWGGGIALEVGQLVIFSLKAHHVYERKELWLQTSIGINLFGKKEDDDPLN